MDPKVISPTTAQVPTKVSDISWKALSTWRAEKHKKKNAGIFHREFDGNSWDMVVLLMVDGWF